MAQLSTLLDRVHDELPAVPEALALRALSDATKEFCTRSHYWQETLPRISLRAGVSTYELYLDEGQQLAALKDVRLDGRKIYPVATELPRLRISTPAAQPPSGYIQWQPGAIELISPPVEAARLDVKAALTLRLGATTVELPDALVDEYGEFIASGAKSRLVRMASQPWHNPDAVIGYAGPYYNAITQAKGRAMSALGDAELQVEMRSW